MTISSSASQTVLACTGGTTFTFSFVGVSASYIKCTYTSTAGVATLLSSSAYTVSLNAASSGQIWGVGGTVTWSAGSSHSNGTLTIQRILPLTQGTSISNQGDFYPQSVEQAIDTVCLELQQVAARAGSYRGTWLTGTAYRFSDIVVDGSTGNYYTCAIANTSGTWATDLAAGDWVLMFNMVALNASVTSAVASASTAAASAITAVAAASTAQGSAITAVAAATTAQGSAITSVAAAVTSQAMALSTSGYMTTSQSAMTLSQVSATTAVSALTSVQAYAITAGTYATAAIQANTSAQTSAITAGTYATAAINANTSAQAYAITAGTYATAAIQANTSAQTSAITAGTYATASLNYATSSQVAAVSATNSAALALGYMSSAAIAKVSNQWVDSISPTGSTSSQPSFTALQGAMSTAQIAALSPTLTPFKASGASHAPGAVPDPGASAGTTRFLREDGTWATPATTMSPMAAAIVFGG